MTPREYGEAVLADVAKSYGLTVDQVLSRCNRMPLPQVRGIVARVLSATTDMTHGDIAELLQRERSSVTNAIKTASVDVATIDRYRLKRARMLDVDSIKAVAQRAWESGWNAAMNAACEAIGDVQIQQPPDAG